MLSRGLKKSVCQDFPHRLYLCHVSVETTRSRFPLISSLGKYLNYFCYHQEPQAACLLRTT